MSFDVCYNPENYYDKSYGICYSPNATPYTPPPPPPDNLNKPVWEHPSASQVKKNDIVKAYEAYHKAVDTSKKETEEELKCITQWKLENLLEAISFIEKNKDKDKVKAHLLPKLEELKSIAKAMLAESFSPDVKRAVQEGEVEFFVPERFVALRNEPAWDQSNQPVKNDIVARYRAFYTAGKNDANFIKDELNAINGWKVGDIQSAIKYIEAHKDESAVKQHLLPLLPTLKQVLAAKVKPLEELAKEEQLLFNLLQQLNEQIKEPEKTKGKKEPQKTPQENVEWFIKKERGLRMRLELVKKAKEELEFFKSFSDDKARDGKPVLVSHYLEVSDMLRRTGKNLYYLRGTVTDESKTTLDQKRIKAWITYVESKLTKEQKEQIQKEAEDRTLDYYSNQKEFSAQFKDYKKLKEELKNVETTLAQKKFFLENLREIINLQFKDKSEADKNELFKLNEKKAKDEIAELEKKKTQLTDPKGAVATEREKLLAIFQAKTTWSEYKTQNYLDLLWEKTRTGVRYFDPQTFGKPENLEVFAAIYGITPKNYEEWKTNLDNLGSKDPNESDLIYGQYQFLAQIKGRNALTLDEIRGLNRKDEKELLDKLIKGVLTEEEWKKSWDKFTDVQKKNFERLLGDERKVVRVEKDKVLLTGRSKELDRWIPVSNGAPAYFIDKDGVLKEPGMIYGYNEVKGGCKTLVEGVKDDENVRSQITAFWQKALEKIKTSITIDSKKLYEQDQVPVYAAVKKPTKPGEEAKYDYKPVSDTGYHSQEKTLRVGARGLGRLNSSTFSPKINLDMGDHMIRAQLGLKTWTDESAAAFCSTQKLSEKQGNAVRSVLLGQTQLVVKGEVKGEKLDPSKKTKFFLLDKETKKLRELDDEEKAGFEKVFTRFGELNYQGEKDPVAAFLQSFAQDLPKSASSAFNKNMALQIAIQIGRMGPHYQETVRQWNDENRREFFTGLGDILTQLKGREQVDEERAYYAVVEKWADGKIAQLNADISVKEKNKSGKNEEEIKDLKAKIILIGNLKDMYNVLGANLIKEKVLSEFRTLDVDLSSNVLQEIGYFVMEYLKAENLQELNKPLEQKDPEAKPNPADKDIKTRYFAIDSIVFQDVSQRVETAGASKLASGTAASATPSLASRVVNYALNTDDPLETALDAIDGRQESLAKNTSHYTWIWQHPGAMVNLFFARNIKGYTKAWEIQGNRVIVKTDIDSNDLLLLAAFEKDKPEGLKGETLKAAAAILAEHKLYLGEEIFESSGLNVGFLKKKGLDDKQIKTLVQVAGYLKDWHDNISRITQPVSGIKYQEILQQRLKKEVHKNYVGEWLEAMKDIPAPVISKRMSMIESEKILALKEALFADEVKALRETGTLASLSPTTKRSEEYFQGRQVFHLDGDFIIRFAQKYGHLLGNGPLDSPIDFLVAGKESEVLKDAQGKSIMSIKDFLIQYGNKLKAQGKTLKLSLDDSSDDASDRAAKLFIQGGLALWDPKTGAIESDVIGWFVRQAKDAKQTTMAQVFGMDDSQVNYPLRFKAGLVQWGYKWDKSLSLSSTNITAQQIKFAGEKFEEVWKNLDATAKDELLKVMKVKEETILHYISVMKGAESTLPQGLANLKFTDQRQQMPKALVFFVKNILPNFVPSADGRFSSNIVDEPIRLAAETKGKKLSFRSSAKGTEKIPPSEGWLYRKGVKVAGSASHAYGFVAKSAHFGVFIHPTIQLSLQGGLIARSIIYARSGDHKYAKDAYSELIKTRLGFLAFQYNPLALVTSGVNNLQQGNLLGAVVDGKFAWDSLGTIRRAKGVLPVGFGIYLLYSGTKDATDGNRIKGVAEIALGLYLIHQQIAALEKMMPEIKTAFKAGEYRKMITGLETEMTDIIRTRATQEFKDQLRGLSPAEAEKTKKRLAHKLLRMGRQVFSALKDFGIEPLAKSIQGWQKITGRKMPTFWKNMLIFAKNPNHVFTVEGAVTVPDPKNPREPLRDADGKPVTKPVKFKAKGWHLVALYRMGIDPSVSVRSAQFMGQKIQGAISSIENGSIVRELTVLNGSSQAAHEAMQSIQAEAGKIKEGALRREGSLPRVILKKTFHALFATDTEKFMIRSIYNSMAFEDISTDMAKEYKLVEKMLRQNKLNTSNFASWKALYKEFQGDPILDQVAERFRLQGKDPKHTRKLAAQYMFNLHNENKVANVLHMVEEAALSPESKLFSDTEKQAIEKRGHFTKEEFARILENERPRIAARLDALDTKFVADIRNAQYINDPAHQLAGRTAPQLPPAFELKSALKAAGLKKVSLGKAFEGIDQSVQERLVKAVQGSKVKLKNLVISGDVNFAHGGEAALESLIKAIEEGRVQKSVKVFAAQDRTIYIKGAILNPHNLELGGLGALSRYDIPLGANGLSARVAAQLNVSPAEIQARYNVTTEEAVKIAEDVKAVKSSWLQAKEDAMRRITDLEKKGTLTPERAKLMRETAAVSWDAEIARVEGAAVEKSAIEKLQAQAEQLRRDIKPLEETVNKAATPEARAALRSKFDELKIKTEQLSALDVKIGGRIRNFAKNHGVMLGILIGIALVKNQDNLFSKRTLQELGLMGAGYAVTAAAQKSVERGVIKLFSFSKHAGTVAGGTVAGGVSAYGHLTSGHFSSADVDAQFLAAIDTVKEGIKGTIAGYVGTAAAGATGWTGIGAIGVGTVVGMAVYEILTLAESVPGLKQLMEKKFTAAEIRKAFREMKSGGVTLTINKPDDDAFFTSPYLMTKDSSGKPQWITQAQYMMVALKAVTDIRSMSKADEIEYIKKVGKAKAVETFRTLEAFQSVGEIVIDRHSDLDADVLPAILTAVTEFGKKNPLGTDPTQNGYKKLRIEIGKAEQQIEHPDGKNAGKKTVYNITVSGQSYHLGSGSAFGFGQTVSQHGEEPDAGTYRSESFDHVVYSGDRDRLQEAMIAKKSPESVTLDMLASRGFSLSFDQLEKYPSLKQELASRLQMLGYNVTENTAGALIYDPSSGKFTPQPAKITTSSLWQAYERFLLDEGSTFPEDLEALKLTAMPASVQGAEIDRIIISRYSADPIPSNGRDEVTLSPANADPLAHLSDPIALQVVDGRLTPPPLDGKVDLQQLEQQHRERPVVKRILSQANNEYRGTTELTSSGVKQLLDKTGRREEQELLASISDEGEDNNG